jgi:2-polyprenyl-6-hydroxyphenyl methylase/3-demethylubiquinone-9 3-methyltransferase
MTSSIQARTHDQEIAEGERFEFGKNWSRFLNVLDDARIQMAIDSLKSMLAVEDLFERTFLDIGSGSGLFSLAARRLGARVVSFDYDPQSVACTQELKRRYFADDPEWQIHAGSVLDEAFLGRLGQFDVV